MPGDVLLDSLGMLSLSHGEFSHSWVRGGTPAAGWVVRAFLPRPPPREPAEDVKCVALVLVLFWRKKRGRVRLREPTRSRNLPIFFLDGDYLPIFFDGDCSFVMIEPIRRRVLSLPLLTPSVSHRRSQAPRAPTSATGQSPNG